MNIYRLLDIKPDSNKIWLLLFPPIYTLWLLAIGKRLLQKQNMTDNTFTFFASATFLLFTFTFVVFPMLRLMGLDLIVTGNRSIPILLTIYFFWFGTIGILANLTVKYERLAKPDYFFGLVDKLDFVKRFIILFAWPLSIWLYQEAVNEYND